MTPGKGGPGLALRVGGQGEQLQTGRKSGRRALRPPPSRARAAGARACQHQTDSRTQHAHLAHERLPRKLRAGPQPAAAGRRVTVRAALRPALRKRVRDVGPGLGEGGGGVRHCRQRRRDALREARAVLKTEVSPHDADLCGVQGSARKEREQGLRKSAWLNIYAGGT